VLRPTSVSQNQAKWAKSLCREMQTAIGRQLRVEFELPREMVAELAGLLGRMDKQPEEPSPPRSCRPAIELGPLLIGRANAGSVLMKDCAGSPPNPEAVIGVA
jgi:hypothetical protein